MQSSQSSESENGSEFSALTPTPSDLFTQSSPLETTVSNSHQPVENTTPAINLQHRSTKKRTSHIWLQENGIEYINEKGKLHWKCVRCSQLYVESATTHAIRHLITHGVYPLGKEPSTLAASSAPFRLANQQSIQTAFNAARLRPQPFEFNSDYFRALLIQCIVQNSMNFNIVTSASLRDLLGCLAACNPSFSATPRTLPASGNTIRDMVLSLYEKTLPVVAKSMRTGLSNVHIAFDLWTGPNRRAYLGITAHWVDSIGQERDVVAGLERFLGVHSGETQAQAFWKVAKRFSVERLLGTFTLDNAGNNETALETISRLVNRLGPTVSTFVPKERMVRCIGHIINLVIKTFLWGLDMELLELELEECGIDQDDNGESENGLDADTARAIFDQWKTKGGLRRLRNLLVYVRGSPQRLDRFKTTMLEVYPDTPHLSAIPIIGNATRWISDHESLKWSLERREALDEFFHTENAQANTASTARSIRLNNDDFLTANDWTDIRDILDILAPLKEATLRFQHAKSNGCIAEILPTFEELMTIFETARATFAAAECPVVAAMLDNGWNVLRKYYNLTDENPIYVTAVSMHPGYRFRHLQHEWALKPDWFDSAMSTVESKWKQEYKGSNTDVSKTHAISQQSTTTQIESGSRLMQNLNAKRVRRTPGPNEVDAFKVFQDQALNWSKEGDERHEVISFWVKRYLEADSSEERSLARMAIDSLSPPAMSASPERLFSSAKRTISEQRCRLGDDVVRALECLKSWSRAGFTVHEFDGGADAFEALLQALHDENVEIERHGSS